MLKNTRRLGILYVIKKFHRKWWPIASILAQMNAMCDMAAKQQKCINKLSPLKIEMIIHKNLTNTYRR